MRAAPWGDGRGVVVCTEGKGGGGGVRGKGEWQYQGGRGRLETRQEGDVDREIERIEQKLGGEKIMQNACLVFAEMY